MALLLVSWNLVEWFERHRNAESETCMVQNLIVRSEGPKHAEAGYMDKTSIEAFWVQHDYFFGFIGHDLFAERDGFGHIHLFVDRCQFDDFVYSTSYFIFMQARKINVDIVSFSREIAVIRGEKRTL